MGLFSADFRPLGITSCPTSQTVYLDNLTDITLVHVEYNSTGAFASNTVDIDNFTISHESLYSTVTVVQTVVTLQGVKDTCTWQYFIKRGYLGAWCHCL